MPTKPTSPGAKHVHHPDYDLWAPSWVKARDVYEGTGGFLQKDRPYLIAHPREFLDHSITTVDEATGVKTTITNPSPEKPTRKLVLRRQLARYENYAATIVDLLTGSLFAEPPARTFGDGTAPNEQVQTWWKNVDGKGTTIDVAMQDGWIVAAVFGWQINLMDKAEAEATTAADGTLPRLCQYTPLDLIDWIEDENGQLTAVKLVEPAPRDSFAKRLTAHDIRVRIVDETTWTLYDHNGAQLKTGEHGFGRLPVEILYGKRRPLTRLVGKAIIGDPQLYLDLYNLISEVRELLRNQTFAILNVPIGQEGDPEREQEKLGRQSGTSNVLFSTNPAQYLSPGGDNVAAYHDHIDRLVRIIYRLASVPWEGDSKDAESADSRKIKRAEMTAVLKKYRNELQRCDDGLTDLLYRSLYGPDKAKTQMETDKVATTYPLTFEPPDLEAAATEAAESIALELGPTATKEIKKRFVRIRLPNLSTEQQIQIDQEIDGQEILTADEKRQQLLEDRQQLLEDAATRMAGRGTDGPVPKKADPAPVARNASDAAA